jgi:NADH-quinone oxidoreductase subunit G
VNRGDASVIETFPGTPLDNDYSMNVADICPVGALTTKDFRFKIRVWFLDEPPGVCTGCARGCNVHLGVANNRVYRYVPRRNDAVNDTWICDDGRLSYKQIATGRLRQPLVRGELGVPEAAAYPAAIAAAAARLRRLRDTKGPGVVAGIASAHATNEDLFTFRRFLEAFGTENSGLAVVSGRSDAILIHAEKGANARGARELGFGDARGVIDRIRGGGIDGIVALGHDIAHEQLLGGTQALSRLDTVIVLDSHASELQHVAHVMLPTRVAAEKRGTLTNAAGRVQRVQPAVEPGFEAYAEGEALAMLGAALALPGFDGGWDARAVSKALSQSVSAFAGRDWDSVGDAGLPVAEGAA